MVLITGSSHLHLVISAGKEVNVTGPAGNELSKTDGVHAAGVWGSYQGTPLLGLQFAEGGQSSTGSILNWAKRLFNSRNTLKESSSDDEISYKDLDAEASKIPIGCDGLLAIETFQGQRTPVTDAQAKGALLGLTLAHTRAHIWRALLEAVCLGTRAAVDALTAAGLGANEIVLSGGPTRSPLWLQMHADAAGLPVVVGENDNGPLLGCAVLAAVGAGLFDESDGQDDPPPTNKNDAEVREAEFQVLCQLQCKVRRALRAMVRRLKTVYPQPDAVKQYDKLYKMYSNAVSNVRGVSHMLTDGIDAVIDAETPCGQGPTSMPLCEPTSMPSNGLPSKPAEATTPWTYTMPSGREAVVAPSMLSADFGNLAEEARMCERAGAQWVHLDVCDNSDGCRGSLTFGPKIINAIHLAAPTLALEVHAMAADLESLVAPLAAAGTSRLIFQLESTLGESKASRSVSPAHTTSVSKRPHDGKNKHGPYYDGTTGQLARAIDLAVSIRQHGMRCGVCITPSTPVEVLEPLLSLRYDPTMQRAIAPEEQSCTEEQNTELLIELVDILAVNPGFGGQNFDPKALQKVTYLRHKFPTLPYIAVDGGINEKTCELALKAGANVLTAGSFVFLQHESSTHSVTMNDVNVRHVKVQTRNVSDGIEPLMKGLNILRNAVKIHGI
jgi:pentose-5-phosphate-3-epimerase